MICRIKDTIWNVIEQEKGYVYSDEATVKMGYTNYEKNTIYIYKQLNKSKKREVFIHELVHAFVEEYGFYNVIEENKVEHEIFSDFFAKYGTEIIKIADTIYPIQSEVTDHA